MINLLPPEQKNELVLKRKTRLIIVLGSAFTVFILCFVLVLLFIKFYLLVKLISSDVQEVNEISLEKLEESKKEVSNYNLKIDSLKSFYDNQILFNKMLEYFLKVDIPKGVYIIYISSEKKDNKINTAIYGFSDLRENLVLFKDNIDKNKYIKSPYFSPESWIKNNNINFNLTFQYEK